MLFSFFRKDEFKLAELRLGSIVEPGYFVTQVDPYGIAYFDIKDAYRGELYKDTPPETKFTILYDKGSKEYKKAVRDMYKDLREQVEDTLDDLATLNEYGK